jgi:hypothetical protein
MSVTAFQDLPLADRSREWDGDAADKRVRKWAGAEDEPNQKYRDAHVWSRREQRTGTVNFTAYKLLIADVVGGTLEAVPRGVMAAGNIMEGARGGLLYECYCSRRDIAQAPHAPQGACPGTCRDLTDAEREARRRETGRPPALRLRTDEIVYTVHDLLHGEYTGIVDDFVVRRGDGVAAYNLAVVVDDAARAAAARAGGRGAL